MAANIIKFPPDGPFDDDYLARLRGGDYETGKHFNAYFRRLLRLKLCGAFGSSEVNELIDEVMFVAITNIMRGQLRDSACLCSYVRSVCGNLTNKAIKTKLRDGREDVDLDRIAAREQTVEQRLLRRENEKDVQAVLSGMSKRDRNVLVDLFYEGFTRDEVCARHAPLTRAQLRMILFHARQRFQKRWREKSENREGQEG
jgi:RNA polymerase sigma factor (sigma-70 family)